ncbi:MAG: phosphate ABC transporter substrate-binding protein [Planctomycetota bacterium]
MRHRSVSARLIGVALSALSALTLVAPASAQQIVIDPELPRFEQQGAVNGQLTSIGSDTMLNLMNQWFQLFQETYPAVQASAEGKGSSTAPPALIANQAQFGPMSRAMDPEEIAQFAAARGFEPTPLIVSIDCIAIFVHADNPIESISVDQLADAFSVAGPSNVTWGDLGVTEANYRDRPVSLYGRNSASGTYKYFKEEALGGVDYRPQVSDNPGSSGVVNAISRDPYGLGYSGAGFSVAGVKIVPVKFTKNDAAFLPTQEHAETGNYPFARPLWLYVAFDPRDELDTLRRRFIEMIFTREGQNVVAQDGAYPVSADLAREQLEYVGIVPDF